jgi:hypothetical protein
VAHYQHLSYDGPVSLTFNDVGRLIADARWRFAKSMPDNPHEYTLKEDWEPHLFEEVVKFIRKYGYLARWWGKPYTQLDVNEEFYWTMGDTLENTILINRKAIDRDAPYDACAPVYDGHYTDPRSEAQNREIARRLGLMGHVLDVGCGTGLVIDMVSQQLLPAPRTYTGIDPSRAMLDVFNAKHGHIETVCTPLRSFWSGREYDDVIALFGVGSLLSPVERRRLPMMVKPGGRWLVMFYREGYRPWCDSEHVTLTPFAGEFPGTVTEYDDYVIVEGRRD